MKKEINFVLEEKDFKKDSGVPKETFTNLFESFKNYLDVLDSESLRDVDNKGNPWTVESLQKEERKISRLCGDAIKGNLALIDDKGQMSSLNSTRAIIMKLIGQVNLIILFRKKQQELEKIK